MSARWALLALLAAVWCGPAAGQGFAGLGAGAEGYAQVVPGEAPAFPRDHLPHPDFRIEWWYVTANLSDAEGRPLGIQWTLFRSALAPGGAPEAQVWMAHAAVTTAGTHRSAERFGRSDTGQAGVTPAPFEAFIDDWAMTSTAPPGDDPMAGLRLRATGEAFAYDLELKAEGPLVLHGDAGVSVKSEAGQASWYYSQPFYAVEGTVTLDGAPERVTGRAWLDREWSSQPLSETQSGWDWVSLHLGDGAKLMGYRLRDAAGDYTVGTYVAPDGRPEPLAPGALTLTPLDRVEVAGRPMPVAWRVGLPAQGLDLTVTALNPQSWMGTLFAYWEGPVTIEGGPGGVGYLEMTGY